MTHLTRPPSPLTVDYVTFPGNIRARALARHRWRINISRDPEISESASALLVRYAHEFFEEGVDRGRVRSVRVANSLYGAHEGRGGRRGYVFGVLYFNIRAGEIFVETSYQRVGDRLLVHGSSTSNAQGRFIAWSEVLKRMP
jgi:hypothetical protein